MRMTAHLVALAPLPRLRLLRSQSPQGEGGKKVAVCNGTFTMCESRSPPTRRGEKGVLGGQGGGDAVEQRFAVGAAHQRIDEILGVRHQTEHAQIWRKDA